MVIRRSIKAGIGTAMTAPLRAHDDLPMSILPPPSFPADYRQFRRGWGAPVDADTTDRILDRATAGSLHHLSLIDQVGPDVNGGRIGWCMSLAVFKALPASRGPTSSARRVSRCAGITASMSATAWPTARRKIRASAGSRSAYARIADRNQRRRRNTLAGQSTGGTP